RECKTEELPEWPVLTLDGQRQPLGRGSCSTASISSFSLDQWCWVECGRSLKHPDLWIRLQPTTVRKGEASRGNALNGFYAAVDAPTEMFYGDCQIQDEGDLLIATRTNFDAAERGLDGFGLPAALAGKDAPALVG